MQLLSRFVCLFMVASVLGGCGFFYPAPPIKDPVIVYNSNCGDCPRESRSAEK